MDQQGMRSGGQCFDTVGWVTRRACDKTPIIAQVPVYNCRKEG